MISSSTASCFVVSLVAALLMGMWQPTQAQFDLGRDSDLHGASPQETRPPDQSPPLPSSSSSENLPSWAEPEIPDRPSESLQSSRSSDRSIQAKGNPGFPGGDPEQEVPVGGGGGAALLAAAGAAYAVRRLRNGHGGSASFSSD